MFTNVACKKMKKNKILLNLVYFLEIFSTNPRFGYGLDLNLDLSLNYMNLNLIRIYHFLQDLDFGLSLDLKFLNPDP